MLEPIDARPDPDARHACMLWLRGDDAELEPVVEDTLKDLKRLYEQLCRSAQQFEAACSGLDGEAHTLTNMRVERVSKRGQAFSQNLENFNATLRAARASYLFEHGRFEPARSVGIAKVLLGDFTRSLGRMPREHVETVRRLCLRLSAFGSRQPGARPVLHLARSSWMFVTESPRSARERADDLLALLHVDQLICTGSGLAGPPGYPVFDGVSKKFGQELAFHALSWRYQDADFILTEQSSVSTCENGAVDTLAEAVTAETDPDETPEELILRAVNHEQVGRIGVSDRALRWSVRLADNELRRALDRLLRRRQIYLISWMGRQWWSTRLTAHAMDENCFQGQ